MAKDMLGNDIKIGDVVALDAGMLFKPLIAKVAALSEGGLAVPTGVGGQQAIAAGSIRLVIDFALSFNPTQALGMVIVVDPSPEKKSVIN